MRSACVCREQGEAGRRVLSRYGQPTTAAAPFSAAIASHICCCGRWSTATCRFKPSKRSGHGIPPSVDGISGISSFLIGQICVVIQVAKYAAVVRLWLAIAAEKGAAAAAVVGWPYLDKTLLPVLCLSCKGTHHARTWQNPSPVIYTYIRVSACAKK